MGWLTRVSRWISKRMKLNDPGLIRLFGGGQTSGAGIVINEATALRIVTVFACVRKIAQEVAALPIGVFRRLPGGGREALPEHPLSLLLDDPNPEMSDFVVRRTIQGHASLRGNGYALIQRDEGARPIALWPLHPDAVRPRRAQLTQGQPSELVYDLSAPSSETAPRIPWMTVSSDLVFHVHGLGGDGILGYSALSLLQETMGVAVATQQFGARHFSQNAQPGGVLTHPGALSDPAKQHIKRSWEEMHTGIDNAHRVAVLEEGMKWEKISVDPEHSQFLQTREHEREEIAAWFDVPPHMIGDMRHSSFATVEQQGINFQTHTLRPWLVNWEREIRRKLLPLSERRTHFVRHNATELMRGDHAALGAWYAAGRQWGWYSIDDVLELEGRNPLPNGAGRDYLVPVNMSVAGAPKTPPPAPFMGREDSAR